MTYDNPRESSLTEIRRRIDVPRHLFQVTPSEHVSLEGRRRTYPGGNRSGTPIADQPLRSVSSDLRDRRRGLTDPATEGLDRPS